MARLEIYLPAMGEGVIEATVSKWLVNVGDKVEEDDSLIEVATDKVDSEVPSPESGIVKELIVNEGDSPQVGDLLLILETDKGEEETVPKQEVLEEVKRIQSTPQEKEPVAEVSTDEIPAADSQSTTSAGKFLSPLVRSIAQKENVSHDELDRIKGSGQDGRITKKDILSYLEQRTGEPVSATAKAEKSDQTVSVTETKKTAQAPPAAAVVSAAGDEIIEMDRMRKLIADHMVHSKHTSPHVTSFIDVDVTNVVTWRNQVKDQFLAREKQKITFMPIFIEAAARALRDYPMVNASVDGTKMILRKHVNIGMATALPNGNLIVPVIKGADQKNLIGLAKDVNDLANRARNNQLQPDEIQGGTFTITNFGTFQSTTGTPIINQPQVAILGVGAIQKKPTVIETATGDAIAIRHIMVLSLSYDHRIVDGALGGMYLLKLKEYLEQFDIHRSI